MSTSRTLLALLERSPAHGYTLKQQYDTWFGQRRPLAFGQVYASLARFERDGYAEMVDVEAGEGPERRLYRITPEGVSVVDEWVLSPDDPRAFATSALFTRVTVALLSSRSASEVLAAQRETHLGRMRELQRRRREASGVQLLSVTYELSHLDADLRWIEESGCRLGDLAAELDGGAR